MSGLSFYVNAHQDDWQLFRGEQAWADIEVGAHVVFVYTTAGDAGRTDGWWQAREQTAIACCKLASPGEPAYAVQTFNGRPITTVTCGSTTSYFLRLPDGNIDTGLGYPATGYQSLAQLQSSNKPIAAVDGSAQYATWTDLCETVATIIGWEVNNAPPALPWVNTHDYDATSNPGDHTDHYATGSVVASFARDYSVVWWVGYDIQNRPANLQPDQVMRKTELCFRYIDTLLALTGYDDYANGPPGYDLKLQKSYFRT